MYFPKSKIQPNLYTNGSELRKLSSGENYIGFYFKTSRGQFFTGKTAGDGLNEQLIPSLSSPSSTTNLLDNISSEGIKSTNVINFPQNKKLNSSNTTTSKSNFITPIFPINDPDLAYIESLRPLNSSGFTQTISPIDKPYSKTLPIRKIPNFIQPIIKESDKQLGIIQRYFCKKTNEAIFIEISLSDYTSLLNKSNTIAWDLYIPISMLWYIKGNREEIFNTNKNLASLIEKNNKWFGFVNYFKENFSQFYLES